MKYVLCSLLCGGLSLTAQEEGFVFTDEDIEMYEEQEMAALIGNAAKTGTQNDAHLWLGGKLAADRFCGGANLFKSHVDFLLYSWRRMFAVDSLALAMTASTSMVVYRPSRYRTSPSTMVRHTSLP